MKRHTESFVRALAEEHVRTYNPDQLAPFPYHNVLQAHPDLDIVYANLEDNSLSGATLYKDGKFSILVNASRSERRQHFTLGHELGHYFLHKDLLQRQNGILDDDAWLDNPNMLYRLDDAESTHVETEANHYAASLLMPAGLVRRGWHSTKSVEELADIFHVSTIAMSIRLTELGLVR